MSYNAIGSDREARNRELIDDAVERARKSGLVAYLLWTFLGSLGVHNFYLGRPGLGALQMAGTVFVWCTYVSDDPWPLVGFIAGIPLGISLLVDMFLIPSRVVACSDRLRARLADSLADNMDWSGV
ncbi:MAG: TM2 domain-containing protein [Dongiaceae bacterium]